MRINLRETIDELESKIPRRIQKKIHIIAMKKKHLIDYDDSVQEGFLAYLEHGENEVGRAIDRLAYPEREHPTVTLREEDHPAVLDDVELREAFASLPEVLAKVVQLRFFSGLSFAKIGRKCGGKTGLWAKTQVERGVSRLGKSLEIVPCSQREH